MPLIELRDIELSVRRHFWTPKKAILRGVSLTVEPGEVVGFLGPNGAGKTTTLKVLLGLARPDRGTARLFDRPPGVPSVRRRLGFMPERAYFPEYLTAEELLLEHAVMAGMGLSLARRRAAEELERVGLKSAAREPLRGYSKGMLQRAGLAQALVAEPELVILDEPMSGLDPLGRRDVRDIISSLKAQGRTVFFSTHILPDVEALCDRVAIMASGVVRKVGKLESLLGDTTAGVEIVAAGDPERLRAVRGGEGASRRGETTVFLVRDAAAADALLLELLRAGGSVVSVQPHRRSLEEVFMREAAGEPR